MKNKRAVLVGLVLIALAACQSRPSGPVLVPLKIPALPNARFMVISDTHLYDTSLGTSGSALTDYLKNDRKLLLESTELLNVAIDRALAAKVDFVLVSGDLTKDGEQLNHQKMAQALARLRQGGVGVYVIDGNHDIENPHAVAFTDSGTTSVESVDPAGFAANYRDCGYGQALYRDPDSLSYVAEPVNGLWLLALDSADYENNLSRGAPETSGHLRPQTWIWLETRLKEAAEKNKAVIALMHHGVVEHFGGQKSMFPMYVVQNNEALQRLFGKYGVRLVFTGHFHANDVAGMWWKDSRSAQLRGKWLMDVETGSLVTWPSNIRTVEFADSEIRLSSQHINQLASYEAIGKDFSSESHDLIAASIRNIASRALLKYGSPAAEAQVLSAQVSSATMAHYQGNEHFIPNDAGLGTGDRILGMPNMSPAGNFLKTTRGMVMVGLWNDPAPADNKLVIHPDGRCETLGP